MQPDPDLVGCTCPAHEQDEPHPCPFRSEIEDNAEPFCTCCAHCTERCAENI